MNAIKKSVLTLGGIAVVMILMSSVSHADRVVPGGGPVGPGRPVPPRPPRPLPPPPIAVDSATLARDAQMLIANYETYLNPRDRQAVNDSLRNVLNIFATYRIYPNPGPGPYYPPVYRDLICDSNNNALIELGGSMLHDFSTMANCQEAMDLVQRGEPYCDYNDNTLWTLPGTQLYDFSTAANCQEARPRVMQGRRFCDYNDNTLRNSDGTLIYDFSTAAECQNAMR